MTSKEEFIHNCIAYFCQNGLKFSMSEIAQAFSISKKTIYSFFDSKESLVESCALFSSQDIKNRLIQYHEQNSSNVIEFLLPINHSVIYNVTAEYGRFFGDLKQRYPIIFQSIVKNNEATLEQTFVKVVQQGMKEGVFRKDIDTVVWVKIAIAFHELMNLPNLTKTCSIESLFTNGSIVFIRGICTKDKGLEMFEKTIKNHQKRIVEDLKIKFAN